MQFLQRNAWILIFVVGFAFLFFAYGNIIVIPNLVPDDPDRGRDWLTRDTKVIDYTKFWFRNFGLWVLAVAIHILVVSATRYRTGEKWAVYSLLYLPVHIVIHMFIWSWTIPILTITLIVLIAGLALPVRRFLCFQGHLQFLHDNSVLHPIYL